MGLVRVYERRRREREEEEGEVPTGALLRRVMATGKVEMEITLAS
jgi:hypothetical protein